MIDVVASEAAGAERERLFRAQVERMPAFAEYEAKAPRTIPVLILFALIERRVVGGLTAGSVR